jgi:quercetin dioxygenase-like cupin family protein
VSARNSFVLVALAFSLFAASNAIAHRDHSDDAVKGAAAAHHKLLLENDQVRVLETKIRPGERTAVHVHPWSAVQYVVSFSDFIRYDESGKILLDSRTLTKKPRVGEALWSGPIARHAIENVGKTDLTVIAVELKSASK